RQRNTDYRLNTDSKGNAFGANLSYTEPLSNSVFLEMNYSYSSNKSKSDRKTFQYDTLAKAYNNVIDSLTNLFEYASVIHTGGTNFRGVGKKYNYQVGISVQQSVLENTDLSKSLFTRQHNRNLFSTASLYYQPTRTKNLRIGYRGNTVQPTSYQLQNVRDVTRYPYIYTGNPALRQEFVHNVQFSYNSFNTATFRNMSVSVYFNQTFDKIVNSLEQRQGGEQLAMPVNIDGVYSVSGNINYSIPINQRSSRNISINTGLDYNRDATVLNSKKNYADQLALNADVVLNYAVNDYLDFSLSAAAAYNKIKYTLQDFTGDSYLSQNYSASISWQFLNGFTLATDAAFNIYSGRTALYNQDYLLWNTMLSRSVFKNRNGELRLRVIDMLNNNIYLTRNITDNSIEDIQALTLRRFGMLSFIYNLRRNTARKD
ncbi:MAG TPA: outer membrane beta-barrel protein, partial [Flavisolibacter sp.]|nr:outer membrane beta-barrel protein [Flavisolibacter sp.]